MATALTPPDKDAQPVRCVQVRWQPDGKTQVETGILITSTSGYAWLMNPKTFHGKRIALSGNVIFEAVHKH